MFEVIIESVIQNPIFIVAFVLVVMIAVIDFIYKIK